ncbi:nucleotidyltransferase domain-containing protein [uncultured Nitratireductor sp.]|uniref:nucleotidyltransferase domain-containing protein n=1 Tax=uncultured Nitratireductor sp. TaxID=520953 RepID=UPI0025D182E0|nr:nucleotidyltransferase domain-containing protein [uncultured Nitratireductor sp.]
MESTASIKTIAHELETRPDIKALFLSGSYGAGLEDLHSDIDFLAVIGNGHTDQFAKSWRNAVGLVGEIVLWRERRGKGWFESSLRSRPTV